MQQNLGGLPTTTRQPRPHYIAASFYTIIAIGGIAMTFGGHPIGLLTTLIAGLYALYLWLGGRFVIFFF